MGHGLRYPTGKSEDIIFGVVQSAIAQRFIMLEDITVIAALFNLYLICIRVVVGTSTFPFDDSLQHILSVI